MVVWGNKKTLENGESNTPGDAVDVQGQEGQLSSESSDESSSSSNSDSLEEDVPKVEQKDRLKVKRYFNNRRR